RLVLVVHAPHGSAVRAWQTVPMDSSAPGPRLLDQDVLVMQQITGFMSNDFDIPDSAGERAVAHVATGAGRLSPFLAGTRSLPVPAGERAVGDVATGGRGLSRFVAGSRSLDVSDADGTPLLHVEDPPDIGLDRFELSHPDGAPLAQMQSRFTLFSTRVGLTLA